MAVPSQSGGRNRQLTKAEVDEPRRQRAMARRLAGKIKRRVKLADEIGADMIDDALLSPDPAAQMIEIERGGFHYGHP
jgi:hypothetical protein